MKRQRRYIFRFLNAYITILSKFSFSKRENILAMKIKYWPTTLIVFFLLFSHLAKAQKQEITIDATQTYLLRFPNGQQIKGTIILLTKDELVFSFQGNEMYYKTKNIDQIYLLKGESKTLIFNSRRAKKEQRFHTIAQGDTTQLYLVKFSDGTKMYGHVLELNEAELTFLFKGDKLFFDTHKVDQIYAVTSEGDIPAFRITKNIGAENLLLSESAHSLPNRETDYRTVAGLYHTVDVGVTDNLTIGGGALLPVGILARAKYTTQVAKNIRMGGGTTILLSFIDDPMVIAYPYINTTFGPRDKYFNISIGTLINFAYLDEIIFFPSIGGVYSLNENWGLMADIYLATSDFTATIIPSVGANWSKRKNKIDFGFGLVNDIDYSDTFPFPYVGYTRRF